MAYNEIIGRNFLKDEFSMRFFSMNDVVVNVFKEIKVNKRPFVNWRSLRIESCRALGRTSDFSGHYYFFMFQL